MNADRKSNADRNGTLHEDDLANEIHGNNQLQGKDQKRFRNERQAVPDVDTETTDVVETFRRMDPDVRAKRKDNKDPKR